MEFSLFVFKNARPKLNQLHVAEFFFRNSGSAGEKYSWLF
jgi:hypothetical protein